MALKAVNFKLEEKTIMELKSVASCFHITMTEAINEALNAYLSEAKQDPFYRLTANVENASPEESADILEQLSSLTDDDLSISTVHRLSVQENSL